MKQALQHFILPLLLLTGYCANAQVKFSASISSPEIGRDEYVQLKLTVENADEVQQIVPPNLKDFIIISGPNQESGMAMINGAVKKYVGLSFILKPKATGNFIIAGALAKADAGDYKANSVKIKVTAQATGNNQGANVFLSPFSGMDPFTDPVPQSTFNDYILRQGENPADKIKKNMFVRVEADKKSAYVGEPVVATYKLYTRLKSESNMTKNPSFNGFSVLDMQQPLNMTYHTEKIEGREYNVYIVRKVQLYPLLTGNLELGIAEIENNVQFIKAEYASRQPDFMNDMFRDFADATIPPEGVEIQKVTLQSKPLTILVKPLPGAARPAGFKGAVGNFSIETKVEKNNFTTDDDGKMAVIIAGEGNLQMINAPEIAWPQGIEGFDPKATDDLYKGTIPVSGRKIFEFPFTVAKPGTYTLPSVELSFFDLKEGKYKTVRSNPVDITVTKGTGKPKMLISEANQRSKKNFLARFFSNRLRVVSLIAVLIIIGLIVWLKRDTKKENQEREAIPATEKKDETEMMAGDVLPEQVNPLAITEECLLREDAKLFYSHLNQELKTYLANKLSLGAEEINRKNIAGQLDAKGISIETAKELQTLLDEIEWQLYTPFADKEKMKGIYEKANSLVQLINTYRS
ncbi:MAG: protein BatD [Ferruginibacter sp.]|nr:protein BatD [Ferruginibacter sp.]